MGRKSKYEQIKKKLDKIKEYARNGATNKEIAGILGISEDTFYEYCNKYPEFSESIINEKIEADLNMVGAMYKRGIGYEYVEEHIEYVPGDEKDKKNSTTKVTVVKKVKKHIPANVSAAAIWLFNRRRSQFLRNQPEIPLIPQTLPEFEKLSDEELERQIEQGLSNIEPD